MSAVFSVYYSKNVYKKWPVSLYGFKEGDYFSLESKEDVRMWLTEHNKIYYQEVGKQTPMKELLRSQIFTILGPYQLSNPKTTALNEIYTLTEAAKIWKLSDGATIRQAAVKGKFKENEARKSDNTWLVTHHGMLRVFGPIEDEDTDSLIVNKIKHTDVGIIIEFQF